MSGPVKINTQHVNNQADVISASADNLRDIAEKMISCKGNLMMQSGSAMTLKMQMSLLYGQTLNAAAQMDTLQEALKTIVQLYEDCEKRITDNANGVTVEETNSEPEPGTDKRNAWQKFIDWVFQRDVDTAYTHTTKEQEVAADARMKQQIQALSNKSRFSEETWENASVEERKRILQEYMAAVMGIMGLGISSKIYFFNEAPSNGYITNGYYSDGRERVQINEYIIMNYDADRSYELLTTVVHELRHAYQHQAIKHPTSYQVSQETIDRWSDSFDNYEDTDGFMKKKGVSRDEAYQMYRDQAVEVDARAFAGQD